MIDKQKMVKDVLSNAFDNTDQNQEYCDGIYSNLSYDAMMQAVEMDFPRRLVDGKSEPLPMTTSTGTFWLRPDPNDKKDFEQLGVGVTMYFKLLKFVIGFFVFCVILETYLMYQYSDGKTPDGFTAVSLGNLAFSFFQCKSSNLKERSDIYLNCQKGALINELKEFGLQS